MTDSRLGRTPRSPKEWAREIQRGVDRNTRANTARAGDWLLTERDGQPVLIKPGHTPRAAGIAVDPQVIPITATNNPYTTPPVEWQTLNFDDATLTNTTDGIVLTAQSVSTVSANLHIAHKPLDTPTNYRITAHLEAAMVNTGTVHAGLILHESATDEILFFGPVMNSGTKLVAAKLSSPTLLTANYVETVAAGLVYGIPKWLQIEDDGTNRIYRYSDNGLDWLQFHTVGRTDFATPDHVGIAVSNNNSGQPATLRLRSFEGGVTGPAYL